jgi:hypothetical protein
VVAAAKNALFQHQKALEIRKRVFGSEHPLVAVSFNAGTVYVGRVTIQFQKSLEIRTRVFGPEHLGVANSLNGIGNVLDDMGKVVLLKLS